MKNSIITLHKNHHTVLFHTVFWLCAFASLLFLFSDDNNPSKIDVIYTGIFLATIMVPVLINLYVLIPLYLKKEKYALFILFFCVNIVLFTQFNTWFFSSFVDRIFSDYYFISYHSNTKLIIIFSVFLITSTLLKLTEDWVYFNRKENRKLQDKNMQIQTQLASLRAQINPHFLFNSLNVIYSLALKNKEETTDAIVQLSDILRYIIYDANTQKVSLQKELEVIKKYLDFQKYRYKSLVKITYKEDIEDVNFSLYPMLLLPLIENSFKHGIHPSISNSFIDITISKTKKEFHFLIKNNFSDEKIAKNNDHHGMGLKSIQKNLKLVYPKNHVFSVLKKHGVFTVSLKIYDTN